MLQDEVFAILDELSKMSIIDMVYYDVKEDCKHFYYDMAVEELRYLDKPINLPPYEKMSPLQKMCVYRISTVKYDADAALRSNIIYRLAFSKIENVEDLDRRINDPNFWFKTKIKTEKEEQILLYRGDTMNSFATTVYELIGGNNVPTRVLENYGSDSKRISEDGHNFIRLVHTVGNFIPVAQSFNTGRSKLTQDYWDLTLKGIFKYYSAKTETEQTEALERILGKNQKKLGEDQKKITDAKLWLNVFGTCQDGWNKFVERNYLQPFVTRKDDNSYGKPRELWEGHFATWEEFLKLESDERTKNEKMLVPSKDNNFKQFEEFFKNTSRVIQERGFLIATAVKQRLNSEKFDKNEFYEKLTGKKANE